MHPGVRTKGRGDNPRGCVVDRPVSNTLKFSPHNYAQIYLNCKPVKYLPIYHSTHVRAETEPHLKSRA
eukprot:6195504-Pleurochrysis_carterae.AAC.2